MCTQRDGGCVEKKEDFGGFISQNAILRRLERFQGIVTLLAAPAVLGFVGNSGIGFDATTFGG
jgi:hypothetical protein